MPYDPFAGMPGYDQYPGYKPYLGPNMPGQTPNYPDTPRTIAELVSQQNELRAAQQPNNDWRAEQTGAALSSMGLTPTVTPTVQQSSWLNPQTSYTIKLSEFPNYEFGIPYGQGQYDPAERARYIASEANRQQNGMYAPSPASAAAQPHGNPSVAAAQNLRDPAQIAAAMSVNNPMAVGARSAPAAATPSYRQYGIGDLARFMPRGRMVLSDLLPRRGAMPTRA